MPAQIPDSIADWSTTAGSNQPSGSANVGPDLNDNLQAMQVAVRQTYTRGSIASAATCDIGTVDAELITVTGTTGISSLGSTLGATGYGVHKLLTFAGALTLTNSASLACITSANITTAAGDSCMVEYGASGWTMLWYARQSGAALGNPPTATIASASTTDIGGTSATLLSVTGTTTITSFGTAPSGTRRWLTFTGALTLTHNATSLILPGAANITTAANDCACVISLGSGNWRCVSYTRANGQQIATSFQFGDGTAAAPSMTFSADTNTGIYRVGTDNLGITCGGTKVIDATTTAVNINTRLNVASGVVTVDASTFDNSLGRFDVNSVFGPSYVRTQDRGSGSPSGSLNIQTGNCATSGGTAGSINITAGTANVNSGATGGSVVVTAGSGNGNSDTAGSISMTAGFAASGGNITLTGGVAGSTGGGDIILVGGESQGGGAGNDGGDIILRGGTSLSGKVGRAVIDSGILSTGSTHGSATIGSGGGSGGAVTGNSVAGQVTFGTGSPTTVTINLPVTWPSAPFVLATGSQSGQVLHVSSTTTSITISSSAAFNSGTKVTYLCLMTQ